jgi:hypothetical protein
LYFVFHPRLALLSRFSLVESPDTETTVLISTCKQYQHFILSISSALDMIRCLVVLFLDFSPSSPGKQYRSPRFHVILYRNGVVNDPRTISAPVDRPISRPISRYLSLILPTAAYDERALSSFDSDNVSQEKVRSFGEYATKYLPQGAVVLITALGQNRYSSRFYLSRRQVMLFEFHISSRGVEYDAGLCASVEVVARVAATRCLATLDPATGVATNNISTLHTQSLIGASFDDRIGVVWTAWASQSSGLVEIEPASISNTVSLSFTG